MNIYLSPTDYQSVQIPTIVWVITFAMSVLALVANWKIFTKAGERGWACLVPFYNLYVLFKITFGDGWKFLFLLVPFANIVITIILPFKLAKAFGKSTGFGFGLLFLSMIFELILAFGDSQYVGQQVPEQQY